MAKRKASIDRISCLSDDILCEILSFLPTKHSIRTSILAKRWRFIWTHVPNIDLHNNHQRRRKAFSKFVDNVMLLNKVQNLNTFRLSYFRDDNDSQVETWITTAIARNVRNFDLKIKFHFKLPESLFTCKTLVQLSLHYCTGNNCTSTIYLPRLKKLHLNDGDDQALAHFISGCPVLEELLITNKYIFGCFNISSPTIKILTVDLDIDYCSKFGYRVKINTPALRYFKVHDRSHKRISITPMPHLIEAYINLESYFYKDSRTIASEMEFLDSLNNMSCLKLTGNYLEEKFVTTKLNNLTKLEVKLTVDWLLIKLLESADNLKVLIVELYIVSWKEPIQVPKCLSLHLRTLRINSNACCETGFNMARYLVRNAKVLEKIHFLRSRNPEDWTLRNLWFERGSKALRFVFD